jgi:hypothetical protein
MTITATDIDKEIDPDLTEKQRDAKIVDTGKTFNVSAEAARDYFFDTFVEPELNEEEENFEDDYDFEDREENFKDEEEDLMVDHYGDDLSREEREERMIKDIEKARDREDRL